jgi:hypothetical protein
VCSHRPFIVTVSYFLPIISVVGARARHALVRVRVLAHAVVRLRLTVAVPAVHDPVVALRAAVHGIATASYRKQSRALLAGQ